MKKTLLIDPFSGASGDMLLASLLDAGCNLDNLREKLLNIPALSGVSLDVEKAQSGVFTASRLKIDLPHEHAHRGLEDIRKIIDEADSILIDEARTPLIISAPAAASGDMYTKFSKLVKQLKA